MVFRGSLLPMPPLSPFMSRPDGSPTLLLSPLLSPSPHECSALTPTLLTPVLSQPHTPCTRSSMASGLTSGSSSLGASWSVGLVWERKLCFFLLSVSRENVVYLLSNLSHFASSLSSFSPEIVHPPLSHDEIRVSLPSSPSHFASSLSPFNTKLCFFLCLARECACRSSLSPKIPATSHAPTELHVATTRIALSHTRWPASWLLRTHAHRGG